MYYSNLLRCICRVNYTIKFLQIFRNSSSRYYKNRREFIQWTDGQQHSFFYFFWACSWIKVTKATLLHNRIVPSPLKKIKKLKIKLRWTLGYRPVCLASNDSPAKKVHLNNQWYYLSVVDSGGISFLAIIYSIGNMNEWKRVIKNGNLRLKEDKYYSFLFIL